MTDPTPTRAQVEALADGMRLNGRMDVHNMLLALRERAEAAERDRSRLVIANGQLIDDAVSMGMARDAAWNDAIEAAGNLESIHGYSNAVPRHRIRALRRAAPTEGEAQSLDDTTRAVLDRAERIVAGQSQQEQRTAEIFLRPTEGEA